MVAEIWASVMSSFVDQLVALHLFWNEIPTHLYDGLNMIDASRHY